jgi:hypothetical protein
MKKLLFTIAIGLVGMTAHAQKTKNGHYYSEFTAYKSDAGGSYLKHEKVVIYQVSVKKDETRKNSELEVLNSERIKFVKALEDGLNKIKTEYDLGKQYADSNNFVLEYNKLKQKAINEATKELSVEIDKYGYYSYTHAGWLEKAKKEGDIDGIKLYTEMVNKDKQTLNNPDSIVLNSYDYKNLNFVKFQKTRDCYFKLNNTLNLIKLDYSKVDSIACAFNHSDVASKIGYHYYGNYYYGDFNRFKNKITDLDNLIKYSYDSVIVTNRNGVLKTLSYYDLETDYWSSLKDLKIGYYNLDSCVMTAKELFKQDSLEYYTQIQSVKNDKNPIRLYATQVFDISEHTDGTGYSLIFDNISNKTIKYVTITFNYYNSVWDYMGTKTLKGVGPIAPKEDGVYEWEYLWFTDVVEYTKTTKVVVQYTDGSIRTMVNPKTYDRIDSDLVEMFESKTNIAKN